MESLREKMYNMQTELPKLGDLGSLRAACDGKREKLLKQNDKLQKTYETAKGELKRVQDRQADLKVWTYKIFSNGSFLLKDRKYLCIVNTTRQTAVGKHKP